MTAFKTVNGIPASANPFTLGRVLRGEWRFDGFVVSDYDAVKQLVTHGMAANESEAARLALEAGMDMEKVSGSLTSTRSDSSATARSPARMDEAVRRILRLKFRLGLFDRLHR